MLIETRRAGAEAGTAESAEAVEQAEEAGGGELGSGMERKPRGMGTERMAQLRLRKFGIGGGVRRGEDTARESREERVMEPRRGEEAVREGGEEEAMERERETGGADEVGEGGQVWARRR